MRARCTFCDRRAFEERLILESANFLVFPTKGQIVEGYVLLVPKRHIICLGELTEAEMEEFAGVKAKITESTKAAYGRPPIFFEHGVVGQSVKHAHMHGVPTEADLFDRIFADFPDYQRVTTLTALQEVFQREGPYLYYENAGGEMFIFHIFKWPQYLRIVLAEVVGLPERGDWKKMDPIIDNTLMLETQKKLTRGLR
ncbi:MAG: HIT family protein [Candidatus Sungiibacteriota bacterium]